MLEIAVNKKIRICPPPSVSKCDFHSLDVFVLANAEIELDKLKIYTFVRCNFLK